MKSTWSVVVVYEHPLSREQAMVFCDQLVERFWDKLSFDIGWWSYDMLQEAEAGSLAVERAARADLIIVATRGGDQPPRRIQDWLEDCLRGRGDREGAIVGLTRDSLDEPASCAAQLYLRNLAHRSGLDYLTQVPAEMCQPIPETFESADGRATQVTSVLTEILSQHPAVSRWP